VFWRTLSVDNNNTTLQLNSVEGLADNDYLLLCNNDRINLVKAADVNSSSKIVTLNSAYSGSTYYYGDYTGKYSFNIIYIRKTGETDNNGNDIYGLYVYIKDSGAGGKSYELIRGVEQLRVEYTTDGSSWIAVAGDVTGQLH
jgi:type IV pilus assembly protein PilW